MSKLFLRTFPILLIFTIFASLTLPKIFAAEEFKTTYNTLYYVKENEEVRVTQRVTIENLTSQYFVSQYQFTIGSEKPKNITAWDSGGKLTPKVEKSDGETKVTLKFHSRVVGKGKELKFGIAYDFPNLATQNGLIWELNLLKISGLDKISAYNLTISIPKSFGPLVFRSPNPSSQREEETRRIITYDKSALREGAPRLGFGEFQLYQLTLTYHLRNSSINLGYTEIALPPDIPGHQKIIQKSLLPTPRSVRTDEDGNYLARYDLRPLEKKEVIWEGFAALFYPSRNFGTGKIEDLPAELIQAYTLPERYWETEAIEIKAQMAKLTDPKLSARENLQRIYNFVTTSLSYDYEKLEEGELTRLGALQILSQKDRAVCMEYTDLFIALARAAGIPAREVNGYAHATDDPQRPLSLRLQQGDVLHAWPQAYLPKVGWVMMDPTWGSTSGSDYFNAFDLSHLAFVIKGESSEYPLPAGSYKTNSEQKDVEVSFSTETEALAEELQLDIRVKFSYLAVSPLSVKATIEIQNNRRVAAFGTSLSLESTLLEPEQLSFDLGTIPPGGTVSRTVSLSPANALVKGEEHLKAIVRAKDFENDSFTFEGEGTKAVRPLYLPLGLSELGLLGFLAALLIFGRRVLAGQLARLSQKEG